MADRYTSPHLNCSALLLIDLQVDFAEGGKSPVIGTAAVLPHVRRLLDAYRRRSLPIIHVVRLYDPSTQDVDLCRRTIVADGSGVVAPGTDGSAIVGGLAGDGDDPITLDHETLLAGDFQNLSDNEVVMFKPRWGAFYRTGLDEHLRQRQVDSVVVVGCNLPNCPRATLFEASERDYRTVVATDAVSNSSDSRIADLELIGVVPMETSEIEAELRNFSSTLAVRAAAT